MSGAPARGTAPRRQRRHHHHHHHHHQKRHQRQEAAEEEEPEEKRPKVNPIFLWASQREQRIVEVRCEDYDKRNRIKLTKTAQGWRSIPRTASNMYSGVTAAAAVAPAPSFQAPAPNSSAARPAADGRKLGGRKRGARGRAKESANGALRAGRKRGGRDEAGKSARRAYGFPLEEMRSNWDEERVRSSEEEEKEEEEEGNERKEEGNNNGIIISEEEAWRGKKERRNNNNKLERLQRDKLFQPRVVLEQLHFSRLPEAVHRNVLQRRRGKMSDEDEENDEEDEEEEEEDVIDERRRRRRRRRAAESPEKRRRNKAGIQDILNMIDATASPVLATDTPSADLPVDSTKTYQIEPAERSSNELVTSYQQVAEDKPGNPSNEEKIEIHEEKILTGYRETESEEEEDEEEEEDIISAKKSDGRSEEERPDEPGGCEEPAKLADYNDSSKILNALRNTPGLSVSVTRSHAAEKAALPRPASKASSSSRSPDSQAECAERLLKTGNNALADSATESGAARNLPGLSIVIPSYRYRNPNQPTASPPKSRVESPESTVNFPKSEEVESKLDGFLHEEEEDEEDEDEEEDEEREMEEEEDDCDSQVLEDLRRQNLDCLHRQGTGNSEQERSAPTERKSGRNSEAQAKCKYQDVEHFDEQVLEELRTRGTVVSPQPSGIPCSPASRRPSSAYLERLLPSPPCSVSCSEDAKNDLTLKGILSSPSQMEIRDHEKQREISNRCDQVPSDHLPTRLEHPGRKGGAKGCLQEARNGGGGRPMSSGDIHSSTYLEARGAKRPVSAEWCRQKSQSACQRGGGARVRMEEGCATSTSTDKLLDPASQLRELIETSGHLIPDPLLVPRDYLPGLAASPATEIPKLLASRPELRLPEALTRPDLLRDPDLLVISLAHLQHVLDHGEGPVSRSRQSSSHHPRIGNGAGKGGGHASNGRRNAVQTRPKLSCKPIGTLMPAPIDLSSTRRTNTYLPLLRVRSGLLKQEPEVSSTASSPDESQLWHPLFGR